jgi:hypothetical protein
VPRFTPAPTFAPAFTSVLLTPTLASTPTLGLTLTSLTFGLTVMPLPPLLWDGVLLVDGWLALSCWVVVCAFTVPNTPMTAAATPLRIRFGAFIVSPL